MQQNRELKIDFHNNTNRFTFRTIHYLGSKLRSLEFIKKTIDELDPKKKGVCDLFAGSGVVSHYLSQDRSVISSDIQNYSTIINKALLKPVKSNFVLNFIKKIKREKLIETELKKFNKIINFENQIYEGKYKDLDKACYFLENCSLYNFIDEKNNKLSKDLKKVISETYNLIKNNQKNFIITKFYGGLYFSFKQSIILDILLSQINVLNEKYREFFLACLLSTTSDLVNTVGKQFAQPLRPRDKNNKPKNNLINQIQKDRKIDVLLNFENWVVKYSNLKTTNLNHKIYNLDFRKTLEILDNNTKIIYADPPYTRDHYSRFYHVLETISLSDTPVISKTKIGGQLKNSRGMYREKRHQSDFCIRSKAPKAFEYLFNSVSKKNKILLLSYSPYDENKKSHPRVVTLENLKKLAKEYFNFVEVKSIGKFSHSKLNKTSLHLNVLDEAEILIVCKN